MLADFLKFLISSSLVLGKEEDPSALLVSITHSSMPVMNILLC